LILQLKNITHSFSPEKQILKDLSLSLEKGMIYALMGSNGAGKTTLFNFLTGFIKPQNGTIIFKNEIIAQDSFSLPVGAFSGKQWENIPVPKTQKLKSVHLSPFKINRLGISRTFQDLRIITKLSVKENIILSMKENPTDNLLNALLPQSFHRNAIQALEKKADEIIEQFFLGEVQNSLAAEISYGQQKLLTLACCVANGASFLLLDEPVAGIQPEYRNKIAKLIKQLKEQGKTILLIEHNTDFIADVADQIFFLHEGKISNFANIQTLKADPMVMEAYT